MNIKVTFSLMPSHNFQKKVFVLMLNSLLVQKRGEGVGVKRECGFQLRTDIDCQNWKCLKLKH